MRRVFVGNSLLFWVSDPFEYGFDNNPTPLEFDIISEDVVDGQRILTVVGQFNSHGTSYSRGIFRNRHSHDRLLLLAFESVGSFVGGTFIPSRECIEIERGKLSKSEIEMMTGVPKSDWASSIGTVRVKNRPDVQEQQSPSVFDQEATSCSVELWRQCI